MNDSENEIKKPILVLYRTQNSTKIIKLKVPVVNTLFLSKYQTQLNTTMKNHHSSKKASGVTILL